MNSYVTLLGTLSYLPGVWALHESLRRTGTRHPLLVVISDGLPDAVAGELQRGGMCTLRLAAPAPIPQHVKDVSGHWGPTFDKIRLFGLAGYAKLVYVDSDMMVLRNIDELFDKPHLSAVAAGRSLNAAWIRLNSGLMVIEPRPGLDQEIFAALPAAIAQAREFEHTGLGDQDLINAYAPYWPDASALHLDEVYNVFQHDLDQYVDQFGYAVDSRAGDAARDVKIVHFIGPKKPWMKGAISRHFLKILRAGQVKRWENRVFLEYRRLIGQGARRRAQVIAAAGAAPIDGRLRTKAGSLFET